jgi:hypothetical protein
MRVRPGLPPAANFRQAGDRGRAVSFAGLNRSDVDEDVFDDPACRVIRLDGSPRRSSERQDDGRRHDPRVTALSPKLAGSANLRVTKVTLCWRA